MIRYCCTSRGRPAPLRLPASATKDTSRSGVGPAGRRFRSLAAASSLRRQRLGADLASRPQVVKPGCEQLADFFLGEEFLDLSRHLRQGNVLPARLAKLW